MTAPGETLAGRYALQRELARGGVGRVLLARDLVLERDVAVKTLLAEGSARAKARFVEEAQVTGQLAHPHVVSLHELGVAGEELFLVMKLVQGQDLKELIEGLRKGDARTVRAYGLRRLLRLFLKVCEAVGFAHARGVIHRDLKPANVMVGAGDEVLVMDWGLAKPLDGDDSAVQSLVRDTSRASLDGAAAERSAELTMEGAVVGTPAYMPPEQANADPDLDARADVYSLGATLYHLLTHRAPYKGEAFRVLHKVLEGPPQAPRVAAPTRDIPPALEAIVLKAMARDRATRYPDAAALAADIEAWLDGRRVSCYRETTGEALRRVAERHRTAVLVVTAAFVLVNALLLGAALLVRREQGALQAAAQEARAAAEDARAESSAAVAAAAALERTSEAEVELGAAALALDALRQEARTAAPLDQLAAAHRRAVEAVDGHAAALAALAQDGDAALARLSAQGAALRRDVDRAWAETLLERSPARALEELGALQLGDDQPLVRARALLRRSDQEAALAALGPAGARPAPAAAALRALLSQAPLSEQEAAFDQAIAADPGAAWLYLRRAEVRAQRGQAEAAQQDWELAALLAPADAWVHGSRLAASIAPFYPAELPRYVERLVHALSPECDQAALLAELCHLYLQHGVADRVKAVDDAVAAGSTSALTGHRRAARIALLGSDLRLAEERARAVLAEVPADRVALASLGEAQLRGGHLDEAAQTARTGLARHRDDAPLSEVLGRVLLARAQEAEASGAHEQAQGLLREARPLLERGAAPTTISDPWLFLGECLAALDEATAWEAGLEAIRRGMALDPLAVFTYNAERDVRPIPGDPRLHRVMARLYLRLERPAAAALHAVRANTLAQFHAARVLPPTQEDMLLAGEAHEALGLPAEANQLYSVAFQFGSPPIKAEAQRRMQRLQRR